MRFGASSLPVELHEDHTPEAIARRLNGEPNHSYLRDAVYGAIDGTVTTFAVVAGAVGASLTGGIVLVLGLANLFADGLSMAVSNYLGTRAEEQRRHKARREEERHVDLIPDGEREEIRQIFSGKGFTGPVLEEIVEVITSDRERWIDTMIQEEHGLPLHTPSAMRAATWTFAAFVIVGALPLMPFIFEAFKSGSVPRTFAVSGVLTGIAFFLVGAFKGHIVERSWLRDGLETLALGGASASLAYAVGWLLRGLVDTM